MNPLRVALLLRDVQALGAARPLIAGLCDRGHAIHLSFQNLPTSGASAANLGIERSNISVGYATPRMDDWAPVAVTLRHALNYCRYLHPDFARAVGLRQRAKRRADVVALKMVETARGLGLDKRSATARAFLAVLRSAYSALPSDPDISAYLAQLDIDLLVATDLTSPDSRQSDYVIACQRMGIPVACVPTSIDALVTQGDMKCAPDLQLVWNNLQALQAVRLHGVDPSTVRAIGRLDRAPDQPGSESRSALCERFGRPGAGRFVIYSSASASDLADPAEPELFGQWLRALRASEQPDALELDVLVSIHGQDEATWRAQAGADPRVALWSVTRDGDGRDVYLSALDHCSAVVGGDSAVALEAALHGARTLQIRTARLRAVREAAPSRHEVPTAILQWHNAWDGHFAALAQAVADTADSPRPALAEALSIIGGDDPAANLRAAVQALELAGGVRRRPSRPTLAGYAALSIIRWLRTSGLALTSAARKSQAALSPLRGKSKSIAVKVDGGLKARLQELYARNVFPRLMAFSVRALPPERRMLREHVAESLSPGEIERFARVDALLAETAVGKRPIFFGPWLSDVGMEALYWSPFLRWYRRRYQIDKDRIVIISRDRSGELYNLVLGRYVDLHDIYGEGGLQALVDEFSAKPQDKQKRHDASGLERSICQSVAQNLNIESYKILPAYVMFQLLSRYWTGSAGPQLIEEYTKAIPVTANEKTVEKLRRKLPGQYVTAQFKFDEGFPATPENRLFTLDVLRRAASRIDVVLLRSGAAEDEELEQLVDECPRINWFDGAAQHNHALTWAAIAGSQAFLGSIDGLAFVAANMGKVCICFESSPHEDSRSAHLELAARRARAAGGALHVLHPQELALFEQLAGPLAQEPLELSLA